MAKKGLPAVNELVLGEVTSVQQNAAFVKLEEYENLEGMIHISEISSAWIRNIRSLVKEGKKIVCRVMDVDRNKRYVSLSLRRVKESEQGEKYDQIRRTKKSEKMLELVGQKLELTVEQANEQIGAKLEKQFAEVYYGFEAAAKGEDLSKLLGKEAAEAVSELAKKNIIFPEVALSAEVKVTSRAPEGVEVVKKVLTVLEKKGANVHYLGAPRYKVSVVATDYKTAERKLNEIQELFQKTAKAEGCEGEFKR